MKGLSFFTFLVFCLLFISACYKSVDAKVTDAEGVEHPRKVFFSSEDPDYNYYEGTSGENRCEQDDECLVSGCNGSTCAAEFMDIDDDKFCDTRMYSQRVYPAFDSCGCVEGECRWYFENDFDRPCETDDDCRGLGFPPEGPVGKIAWRCRDKMCYFGDEE